MKILKQLLNDNSRGATSIFKDALKIFLAKDDSDYILKGTEQLKNRFPAMGLFVNLWKQINNLQSIEDIHGILQNVRHSLAISMDQILEKAGNSLTDNCSVMTISHSSYVRELIIRNKHKINSVYCLESAPENEGIILANLLINSQINTRVIPDTGYLLQLTKATHIIVGSDLISENFFINKSGTKDLVEIAVEQGKNVWILGDELRYISDYEPENIPETFEMITMRDEFRVFR